MQTLTPKKMIRRKWKVEGPPRWNHVSPNSILKHLLKNLQEVKREPSSLNSFRWRYSFAAEGDVNEEEDGEVWVVGGVVFCFFLRTWGWCFGAIVCIFQDLLDTELPWTSCWIEWLPELRKVTKWCAISVILAFLGQCQLRVHNWHTNLPYRSAQGKSNGSGRRRRSRGDKVWNFEKQSNPKCFKILPWCQDGTDTCQLLMWWMKINRWCTGNLVVEGVRMFCQLLNLCISPLG